MAIHSHPSDDTAGIGAGMMLAILALTVGTVIGFAALVWTPWSSDNSTSSAGNGTSNPVPMQQSNPSSSNSGSNGGASSGNTSPDQR